MTRHTFAHSGDLGDIIAALPTLRALGGGNIIIGPPGKDQGRESLCGERFESLRPLLEAQPYIGSVQWQADPKDFTHDLRGFRVNHEYGESLADWQARHLNVKISHDPWLLAMRSPASLGRAVFARSARYHNDGFPWHILLTKHRNALFVGLKSEHDDFQRKFGGVEYCSTRNLLELAEVIAGSHLFVGNQSCPFWIAVGLGVPLIQEVWQQSPNSQIKRPNARYLMRGPFNL